MKKQLFRVVQSRTVCLPIDNVDTDQIIPARFLKGTTREGLGKNLFADWRYDENGNPRPDFVLNGPEVEGAEILVVGENFGCGSSREHAPWALVDYGFRAVIGTSIADIFKANALKNALLPAVVDGETHRYLLDNPGVEITIDLESRSVQLPDGRRVDFPVDDFARYCLLNGLDELDFLLGQEEHITAYEETRKITI
jgi:3-isopropylmalate/(R)-2-methylmalate dehydratase small subunit